MLKYFLMLGIVFNLFGCSRTVEHYEYSQENVVVDGGTLVIGLLGEFSEQGEGTRRKTVRGNPYTLSVSFVPSTTGLFCINRLEIYQGNSTHALSVAGEKCGTEVKLRESDPIVKLYSFQQVNLKIGESASIVIVGSVGADGVEQEYRLDLKSIHRSEKRNDFLDMILSA